MFCLQKSAELTLPGALLWGDDPAVDAALSRLSDERALWKFYWKHVWQVCVTMETDRIRSRAMTLFAEIGMEYPELVSSTITDVILMLSHPNEKIRAGAVYILGRIGRSDFDLVIGGIGQILLLTDDPFSDVRMSVVRGAENIAASRAAELYPYLPVFAIMLDDKDESVRIETPALFRQVAEKNVGDMSSYLPKLDELAQKDISRAVRSHAQAAADMIRKQQEETL